MSWTWPACGMALSRIRQSALGGVYSNSNNLTRSLRQCYVVLSLITKRAGISLYRKTTFISLSLSLSHILVFSHLNGARNHSLLIQHSLPDTRATASAAGDATTVAANTNTAARVIATPAKVLAVMVIVTTSF
ncbi:hypothetical protein Vafri_21715, partial [Volvox africanus]